MTFEELDKLTQGKDSLIAGTNQDLENVIIRWNKDRTLYEVTTNQSNGWIRTNIYHKDGSIEESYHK